MYSATVDNERFCCGVYEIGGFCDESGASDEIEHDTPEELLAYAAEQAPKGAMLTIWFYKPKTFDGSFEKEYHWAEVRKIVKAIPNVVHIGTTVNPNSGNRIDGYAWINSKKDTV